MSSISYSSNRLNHLGYDAQVLPEGAPCTRDYRLNRVRIFVDGNNKIVQEPRTG